MATPVRLYLFLVLLFGGVVSARSVERSIVFQVDGLHRDAINRLKLPVMESLIKEVLYCQQSYMIAPHHPTVGEYGRMHTSSFPNPVLQAGSVFVRKDNQFLQEMFPPEQMTAFVANTPAYRSVSRGFDYVVADHTLKDENVVDLGIQWITSVDPAYFRIHLQTAGNEGRYLSYTSPDKAYFRNIWGKGENVLGTFVTSRAPKTNFPAKPRRTTSNNPITPCAPARHP